MAECDAAELSVGRSTQRTSHALAALRLEWQLFAATLLRVLSYISIFSAGHSCFSTRGIDASSCSTAIAPAVSRAPLQRAHMASLGSEHTLY
jgi:hypothetical protein